MVDQNVTLKQPGVRSCLVGIEAECGGGKLIYVFNGQGIVPREPSTYISALEGFLQGSPGTHGGHLGLPSLLTKLETLKFIGLVCLDSIKTT